MMFLSSVLNHPKKLLTGLAMMSTASIAGAADVQITDAMVRAVPPVSTNTAAFLTLTNQGRESVELVSVDSSVAERVEIHGHRHEGDIMVMYKVDDLSLPVGKTVKLESGGYHIMMMGLKKALKVGDSVDLTLHFSDSDAIDVKAPVKGLMKTMSKDPHSKH